MKSTLIKLTKISRELAKNHPDEIEDIVLFGSMRRGKQNPGDIDILVIFKKSVNKDVEYEFRSSLGDLKKSVSVVSKTKEQCKESSFDARESILFEGYSLVKNQSASSAFGYSSFGMFIYETKGMSNARKTKFYYALNGRGNKGVLEELSGIRLSDNVILVPLDKIESAKEFFEFWEINYKYVPSLFPQRIARNQIIGR